MHINQFDTIQQKLACALTMLSTHSKSPSVVSEVVQSMSCGTDTAFLLYSMCVI